MDAVADVAAVAERLRGGAVEHDLGAALPVEGPVGCGWSRRASTRNRPAPPSGSAAVTTRTSAESPASTGFLRPVDASTSHPAARRGSPASVGSHAGPARGGRGPAASRPPATSSSSARCSSLPSSAITPPGISAAAATGSGASRRPISVMHDHRSRSGRPPRARNRSPEDADLGQLAPTRRGSSRASDVDDLVAVLGVVAARQHVARGVAQQLLLFGQVEVHGRSSQSQDRRGDDGALNLVASRRRSRSCGS